MPCFAIRAVGLPGCRFGLFGTACIVPLCRRNGLTRCAVANASCKKPGAVCRPGFLQESQIALSCTSRVTRVNRNSWIVTSPAAILKTAKQQCAKKALGFVSRLTHKKSSSQNCELTGAKRNSLAPPSSTMAPLVGAGFKPALVRHSRCVR